MEIDFEQGVPVRARTAQAIDAGRAAERAEQDGRRATAWARRPGGEPPGGDEVAAACTRRPAARSSTPPTRELESLTLDRETLHYKEIVAQRYAELVYYGQWFTPLREALDAFVDETQKTVTGTVRLKLYKGNCTAGRRATPPIRLYREDFATFGHSKLYNQKDAEGFINLFGLPLKVRAMMNRRPG